MNLTPEQQKELLEAALNLAAIAERNTDDVDDWDAKIAAVEAFKPNAEPLEPLECWANVYPDGSCTGHPNSATATAAAEFREQLSAALLPSPANVEQDCSTHVAPFLVADADDRQKHMGFWDTRAST